MSLHQNISPKCWRWQISADICQHILPRWSATRNARRLRRQPERTGTEQLPAAEQAALAQLAAWGIGRNRLMNRAVSIMTVCRWKIRRRSLAPVQDDTGGAGMSNERHLMRCGNECWRAAGRRSVIPS